LLVSPTGSGKTVAFLVPLMQLLHRTVEKLRVTALIVAPTQELAAQIYAVLEAELRHLELLIVDETDKVYSLPETSEQMLVARGIDFEGVDLILQLAAPSDPDDYVHRVGRTARVGHAGSALLLLDPSELAFADV
uniref:ATP-dependent RNA helicase n=1 Tax=Dermatophagoides pteronyssinus TaxID=6956 RepID=A0A6P6Y8I6_DERPT